MEVESCLRCLRWASTRHSWIRKSSAGLSPAIVRAFIDAQLDRVRVLGYEVESCLVDLGATAEAVLTKHLRKRTFDCVLIGAGMRAPEQVRVFESG